MYEEPEDEQYDESGEETHDSDSMRSPNRRLAEKSDPIGDADSAARATRVNASSGDDTSSDQDQDVPRANYGFTIDNSQGGLEQDAEAPQQTPTAPNSTQPALTPDDSGALPTSRPRLSPRPVGQIPPLPPDDNSGSDASGRGLTNQIPAPNRQQQLLARHQQIAQINNSPAYQGDDGRWKKQAVDEDGLVNEYDALDAGMGTTDGRTGDIYLQTASGPQKIGNDPLAAQLGRLVQERSQVQNQMAADQAAIDSSKEGLKAIAQNLDQYGGVPQRLEAQMLRYAPSSAYPSDPNDPATQKAAAAYQAAQDQLAQFKSAHPEYAQYKSQQAALLANIQQQQTQLDAQKAAMNGNLANGEYVRIAGTIPPDDTPALSSGDAPLSEIYTRAAEIAGQTGVPRSAAFFSALSEAKARGMTTAGGVPIDDQLQSVPPEQWLPQLTSQQVRAAVQAGYVTKQQGLDAVQASKLAAQQAQDSADNGVGVVQDFAVRALSKFSSVINRASEGLSRFIAQNSLPSLALQGPALLVARAFSNDSVNAGAGAAANWFKGNADAMDDIQNGRAGKASLVNPSMNNTVHAGVADAVGFMGALAAASAVAEPLLPEIALGGAGEMGGLSVAGRFLRGAGLSPAQLVKMLPALAVMAPMASADE